MPRLGLGGRPPVEKTCLGLGNHPCKQGEPDFGQNWSRGCGLGVFQWVIWVWFFIWMTFDFGAKAVGVRYLFQGRRMWPQALGIRRPWGVGELGPVQGMVEGEV